MDYTAERVETYILSVMSWFGPLYIQSLSSPVPRQSMHHFVSSVPLLLASLTSLTSVGRVDRAQPTQGSSLSQLRCTTPQDVKSQRRLRTQSLIIGSLVQFSCSKPVDQQPFPQLEADIVSGGKSWTFSVCFLQSTT